MRDLKCKCCGDMMAPSYFSTNLFKDSDYDELLCYRCINWAYFILNG